MSSDPKSDVLDHPNVSQPLPIIRVERPTADRGADDVREHLDGPRCELCNVPVATDEQSITVEEFGGVLAYHHVCKGHREHPDSIYHPHPDPERYRFCPECGIVTTRPPLFDVCRGCDPDVATTVQEQRRKRIL